MKPNLQITRTDRSFFNRDGSLQHTSIYKFPHTILEVGSVVLSLGAIKNTEDMREYLLSQKSLKGQRITNAVLDIIGCESPDIVISAKTMTVLGDIDPEGVHDKVATGMLEAFHPVRALFGVVPAIVLRTSNEVLDLSVGMSSVLPTSSQDKI